MDPDLSFIYPDISLNQVRPLEVKRVIAFVNHFIMRNVRFLNVFAANVERRIFNMENRINKLEVELQLLEAKLDSIPGIQNLETVSEKSTMNLQMSQNNASSTTSSVDKGKEETGVVELEESATLNRSQTVKIKAQENPLYSKYFRMLKLGIVEAAVKQKMASEGVDPSILNNPDALLYAMPVPVEHEEDIPSSYGGDDSSLDSDSNAGV